MEPQKLPITAIVVGLNEGHHLRECLTAIKFCEELIYVDLGSTDESVGIAKEFNAHVYFHEKVPSCEYVQASAKSWAANDWLLFLDPDEHLDENLVSEIMARFSAIAKRPSVGAISAPWQFHFKGRPLVGTPWGGRREKDFMAHRDRFEFIPEVHRGRLLRSGFERAKLNLGGQIDHYWSNSWAQLLEKHWRYLKTEGGSRYRRGDRISFGGLVVALPRIAYKTFRYSWRPADTYRGVLLSFLWIAYNFGALVGLWLYCLPRSLTFGRGELHSSKR